MTTSCLWATPFRYNDRDMVDLSDYTHSGTWDLIRSPGKLSVYNATKHKPKLTDITYHIVLRRKTLFYTGACQHVFVHFNTLNGRK